MKKLIEFLALGYHRMLLILLLITAAIGSFALGFIPGLICSWICLVLVSIVWTPERL